MSAPASPDTRPRRQLGSAVFWVALGFVISFGIAGILSIGIFFLAGGAAMIVWALVRRISPLTIPAALIGAGLTPLYIAALNWRGPGLVCEETATGQVCGEYFDPTPFLFSGIALILLGSLFLVVLPRARRIYWNS